jgi:hypothetical protein
VIDPQRIWNGLTKLPDCVCIAADTGLPDAA